jgi:hypothetical protein
MRQDEKFVIESIATAYSGDWKPGEDPPDAYLIVADRPVAVEISTLTQHVTDDRGTRPRLSDDIAASRLPKTLNADLKSAVPDGKCVTLVLSSPILEYNKTRAELKKEIILVLSDNVSERKTSIRGNQIEIYLSESAGSTGKKIGTVIRNRASSPNILTNARYILEDRIKRKMEMCEQLMFAGPIWLALLNHYFLADLDTYKHALQSIPAEHPFEKILLVSESGSVDTLFDRSNPSRT